MSPVAILILSPQPVIDWIDRDSPILVQGKRARAARS
jgi:hypothetical protein